MKPTLTIVRESNEQCRAKLREMLVRVPPDKLQDVLQDVLDYWKYLKSPESGQQMRAAEASPIQRKIKKNRIRSERANKLRGV